MSEPLYRRREVVALGVGATAALGFGAAFWRDALGGAEGASTAVSAGRRSGYGPRRAPDRHGIRLPRGFRVRRVARGGEKVRGTGHRWHLASDGAATFRTGDGGWILVSNSEELRGGAGAIRFDRHGAIQDAYAVLSGTTANCSGGSTPWGTWLSCEEYEDGQVWECDPTGGRRAQAFPAMGIFKHEAAAVDPKGRRVYLTEDLIGGALYRFTPRRWPKLAEGLLEVAKVDDRGATTWARVPDPRARGVPTRRQVPGVTAFKRGEGIWFDSGTVYVATTGDSRIHAYDTRRGHFEVIYDGLASRKAPLVRVDQITVSRAGELFVCEDLAAEEIDLGVITPAGRVARFLSATGHNHDRSELTGVTFDPSGRRLYLASQRAHGGKGEIYEISGPFRGRQGVSVPER